MHQVVAVALIFCFYDIQQNAVILTRDFCPWENNNLFPSFPSQSGMEKILKNWIFEHKVSTSFQEQNIVGWCNYYPRCLTGGEISCILQRPACLAGLWFCVAWRTCGSHNTQWSNSASREIILVLLGGSLWHPHCIPHHSPGRSSRLEADPPQNQLFDLEFSIP